MALVLMALAGCQSVDYYKSPVGVTPTTAATLMGSRAENPSPFRKDLRAYVARIDGKLTGGGPNAWGQPVLITAGKHDIAIGVAGGENMFASNSRFGLVEARATLQTGIRIICGRPFGKNPLCMARGQWLGSKMNTASPRPRSWPF